MTNLEKMNSSSNTSCLGYIGAALAGTVLQAVVHLNMAGMFGLSVLIILAYSFFISTVSFFAEKTDNIWLLHLNELWFTLDEIIQQKNNSNQL